ncbi:DUF4402 domain-containing protein [Desulfobotulus sp. H1]|uniref:DUF4402 domain-containing protein n=1 Tax=Desulfobotulus pelophilus TaxID=2823377 RepID=A0ABT3NAA6_9BACT|nr:DUF4402 domain-containing protein [Desulfobotulus pelophilus]MCW7753902.1 DUF4402 domain-containing protein [Desulfobotulus pelophilus]
MTGRNTFIFALLCTVLFLLQAGPVWGASFHLVHPLRFGQIIASPYADAIGMDASSGPAVPRNMGGGWSRVTGGNSGLIRYSPGMPGQQVQLLFPASVSLYNGHGGSLVVGAMDGFSTQYVTAQDMADHFLHIGGVLNLQPGASGIYGGSITITINILNP